MLQKSIVTKPNTPQTDGLVKKKSRHRRPALDLNVPHAQKTRVCHRQTIHPARDALAHTTTKKSRHRRPALDLNVPYAQKTRVRH